MKAALVTRFGELPRYCEVAEPVASGPTEAVVDVVAAAASPTGLVLDARNAERFTGEVTQIDPRPGHIPGAANAPWAATIDPETKRFRPAADLRDGYLRRHAGRGDGADQWLRAAER